jgi:hypothetical protein
MDSNLSDDEIKTLASLLAKLDPGFLPPPIFYQVARLTVTPIIEIIPLHYELGGKIDVLLLQRDQNDPIWPGKWHVPRTVVRASDDAASPFVRILSDELANTPSSQPVFVKNVFRNSGRGVEASQIYCVEITGKPTIGELYDIKQLPGTMLESQSVLIPAAVETFLATRKPTLKFQ